MLARLSTTSNFIRFGCKFEKNASFCAVLTKYRGFANEVTERKDAALQETTLSRRSPFAKNLFLGKFDKDILTYPEVLDRERAKTLEEMVAPVEKFFDEQVDSKKIDRDSSIPDSVMNGLKSFGLFGQQIPTEYGGLGLNATEYARLGEVIAADASIGVTLAAHQAIGLKGILIAGNEKQKEKYLPKLATGEHIAAFCLTEPSSGSDAASVQTKATLSPDGKFFHLNGGKIWISNGGIADVLTVFARTEVKDGDKVKDKVTAFIVERAFGGVTSGKPEDKLGIRGSNTCEIHFDNTPVPVENVLGEVGQGFKIAVNILNSGRFSMGSGGAGAVKRLLKKAVDHAVNRKQFNTNLSEFGLIQEKFANMACMVYAMESMAYLTAGMIDSQENADCAVEAAIVKIYSSESVWYCVNECLQILGGMGYMKEFPYEQHLRDCRILMIFEGTNEILRLFVALNGCQHAGKELAETVRKLRNPLFHPNFVFSKILNRWRQQNDKPKLDMDLQGYIHPSLREEAKWLEYGVKRMQYVVELVLQRHGSKVVEHQLELKRLADIAIDLFAMTACLGRASRSYCIGLPNADHEMILVNSFCTDAMERIKANVRKLEQGPFHNNDVRFKRIAETMFKNQGYCATHPLTRNF